MCIMATCFSVTVVCVSSVFETSVLLFDYLHVEVEDLS